MKAIKILAAPLLALLCSTGQAADLNLPDLGEVVIGGSVKSAWNKTTIGRELLFDATLLADYSQTKQIRDFCVGRVGCAIHETNPIIRAVATVDGKLDNTRVRNYFIAAVIGHAVVTNLLSEGLPRAYWQMGTIAIEAVVIGRNAQLGLKMKF